MLSLILLMWRIGWVPNNASKWQMGFNLVFKGLNINIYINFMFICINFVLFCALIWLSYHNYPKNAQSLYLHSYITWYCIIHSFMQDHLMYILPDYDPNRDQNMSKSSTFQCNITVEIQRLCNCWLCIIASYLYLSM